MPVFDTFIPYFMCSFADSVLSVYMLIVLKLTLDAAIGNSGTWVEQ